MSITLIRQLQPRSGPASQHRPGAGSRPCPARPSAPVRVTRDVTDTTLLMASIIVTLLVDQP